MTPPRIVCDVPGCANSSARFYGCIGYLCSRHWRQVPKALRRRDRSVIRALIKRGEVEETERSARLLSARAHRVAMLSWRAMVRAATRSAAGL